MCVTLHPLSSFSIRMQKAFLLLFLFLFPSSNVSTRTATPEKKVATSVPAPQKMDGEQLFEDMQLGGVVNFLAFRQAVAGYNLIKQKSKSILTLIDFTKPSTEKRLFVFDMEQKKMLYSSVVSHGKNSGENYATSFSNEVGSYKSSLGFYLTGNTYQGRNGYSLLLDGLEKGINDRARETCHRSSWRRIRQPFRLQIRQTGTKLRLSGFTTGTDQTYYQYDKRGKRTLYLCQ